MPLSGGEPSPYFEWEYKGLNSASDTGWRPAPLLLEHLRNNHPDLKVLNLDGRGLGDEAALPLVRALEENTTVTSLRLGRNQMDEALGALAEILKTNASVTSVDVRQNDMGAGVAASWAALLATNATLTDLNLSSNQIGASAKDLAEALGKNSTLRTLSVEDCGIEDAAAVLLLEALGGSGVEEFRGANNRCLEKATRKRLRAWAKTQQ